MATTRGVRNNNPGNIVRNPANKWQGRMALLHMTPEQRTETRFEVFASPAWGIRALCVLLIGYFDRGYDTIAEIIPRYAPSTENDTSAYVRAVTRDSGFLSKTTVDMHDFDTLRRIVEAIISHENAGFRYPSEVIEEGLRMAGVVKPHAPLVSHPAAAQAATITAVATGGTAALANGVNQMLPLLQSANQLASSTHGMPPWLQALVLILVLASIGASIYAWLRLRRARKAVST